MAVTWQVPPTAPTASRMLGSPVPSRKSLGPAKPSLVTRSVYELLLSSKAMRTLWETLKIIVEPSGAVPYAAVIERKLDLAGKRVGIILTGGNLDLDSLPWANTEVL